MFGEWGDQDKHRCRPTEAFATVCEGGTRKGRRRERAIKVAEVVHVPGLLRSLGRCVWGREHTQDVEDISVSTNGVRPCCEMARKSRRDVGDGVSCRNEAAGAGTLRRVGCVFGRCKNP